MKTAAEVASHPKARLHRELVVLLRAKGSIEGAELLRYKSFFADVNVQFTLRGDGLHQYHFANDGGCGLTEASSISASAKKLFGLNDRSCVFLARQGRCGEMADATDLKSVLAKAGYGFESHHRHPRKSRFTRGTRPRILNGRSRTDAHENAPKRSLFVNYSSSD